MTLSCFVRTITLLREEVCTVVSRLRSQENTLLCAGPHLLGSDLNCQPLQGASKPAVQHSTYAPGIFTARSTLCTWYTTLLVSSSTALFAELLLAQAHLQTHSVIR